MEDGFFFVVIVGLLEKITDYAREYRLSINNRRKGCIFQDGGARDIRFCVGESCTLF